MMRPTPDDLTASANVAVHSKQFVDFVNRWKQHELEGLPVSQNAAVAQGRCQVLQELVKLFRDAPTNQRSRLADDGERPFS
ncbi:hypothetical protein [uncultured Paraglaciecola sp.]|uniref:hypothetical protein n=1 Tax=uncultured Paraglaciecola sp. TaxID=1765024 RepID=UPI00261C31CF|nr:hypothetical protein [uncultured Paraglaciecola sp.]